MSHDSAVITGIHRLQLRCSDMLIFSPLSRSNATTCVDAKEEGLCLEFLLVGAENEKKTRHFTPQQLLSSALEKGQV